MDRRIAAVALGLCLAAPLHAQSLTVGIQSEPTTLDPQFNLLGTNTAIARNMFDSLIRRDPKLQLLPGLALSWAAVDETTWEFKLREGVTFHDGSPFTADDVKFTFARVPNLPGNPNSYNTYLQGIKEVVVVDAQTVRFITDGPNPLLPTNLSNLFILSGAKGNRATAEFNSGQAVIGTGPFKYVSWQPGSPVVVERNAGYWGGSPQWQRASFRPIAQDSVRVASLLSGDVDFINAVPISGIPTIQNDRRFAVFGGPSSYVYMFYPNMKEGPLEGVTDPAGAPLPRNPFLDPRVRQAISVATNRQAIVDRVMEGRAAVANQAVPEGFFGHAPNIPPAAYDVERARTLLREAGYPTGFVTPFFCPNDRFVNDAKICEAAAQMLGRIGIRANLQALPRAVFFPQRAKKEMALNMAGWGSLTGESSYFLTSVIHTPTRELNLGAINVSNISVPALDTLMQRARRTLDDNERRALLQQVMEETITQNLVIPVLTFEATWAGKANLRYTPRADEETQAIEITAAQ